MKIYRIALSIYFLNSKLPTTLQFLIEPLGSIPINLLISYKYYSCYKIITPILKKIFDNIFSFFDGY